MGRGPDPDDERIFGPAAVDRLRAAVDELSWLLGRRYAPDAAGKLVGDRHQLTERQRKVVARAACGGIDLALRRSLQREVTGVVAVDGFNQVIGLERALAGGPLFRGRDGALRDLAQVHGHPVLHEAEAGRVGVGVGRLTGRPRLRPRALDRRLVVGVGLLELIVDGLVRFRSVVWGRGGGIERIHVSPSSARPPRTPPWCPTWSPWSASPATPGASTCTQTRPGSRASRAAW